MPFCTISQGHSRLDSRLRATQQQQWRLPMLREQCVEKKDASVKQPSKQLLQLMVLIATFVQSVQKTVTKTLENPNLNNHAAL